MSLLEELRQKAEVITGAQEKDMERLAHNAERVDATLRRSFSFCLEVASYLNVISPANKRSYAIAWLGSLDGMRLAKFNVDYRTTSVLDKPRLDYFFVRYTSSADHVLEKQLDYVAAEKALKSLAEVNLQFEQEDLLNEKGKILRRSVRVPCIVRSELIFKGDYPDGLIRVGSRNVERFGRVEFIHDAEELDVSLLEDYVKLIIGDENQVRQRSRQLGGKNL
jgi:hypothetical protein